MALTVDSPLCQVKLPGETEVIENALPITPVRMTPAQPLEELLPVLLYLSGYFAEERQAAEFRL